MLYGGKCMHWRIRLNETVSLTQKSPFMESVNVPKKKISKQPSTLRLTKNHIPRQNHDRPCGARGMMESDVCYLTGMVSGDDTMMMVSDRMSGDDRGCPHW
jgi:hypothetical protein